LSSIKAITKNKAIDMSILISVPAGRCHRRSPDSKWVDPAPEKGSIEMKFEDDLMHLCKLPKYLPPRA
jgi:hypothetical protein